MVTVLPRGKGTRDYAWPPDSKTMVYKLKTGNETKLNIEKALSRLCGMADLLFQANPESVSSNVLAVVLDP